MKRLSVLSLAACAVLGLLCLAPQASAAMVTLTPAADTSILENEPDHNMGANSFLVVGTTQQGSPRRGLLRFDLGGQIPAGATIQSATLTLEVVDISRSGRVHDLHRLLMPWGEGSKRGALGGPAGAGEATWNDRLAPNTPWGAPGGLAGTDFVSQPSDSITLGPVGEHSAADLAADVALWLADPSQNHGWLLKARDEGPTQTALRIGAREDASARPTLVIEFSPPALDGDANGDGRVDLADFLILKNNFGTGSTREVGDFNGDGRVDLADFLILKSNFGQAQAVPEPASWLLALAAIAGLAPWAKRAGRGRELIDLGGSS